MTTAAAPAGTLAADTTSPAATGTPAPGADAATAAAAAVAATAKTEADAQAAANAAKGTAPEGQAPARVVPDKYELKLPDGSLLDQTDVDSIAALAKTKGLTQDEAAAVLTEHHDALTAQGERFRSELEAHTEVGGAQLAVAQQHANAVLDKFLPANSPEGQLLRSGLNKSGYANWTPLVLLLARIGKSMAEDTPIGGDATRSNAAPKDAASVLYGENPA